MQSTVLSPVQLWPRLLLRLLHVMVLFVTAATAMAAADLHAALQLDTSTPGHGARPFNSPPPPSLPPVWTADFFETQRIFLDNGTVFVSHNYGRWAYSWPTRQWRVDHGKGERANWCQRHMGFNASADTEACSLYFVSDGKMFVNYPDRSPPMCCQYCVMWPTACEILKPDWIVTNQTRFAGKVTVNGTAPKTGAPFSHTCLDWELQGFAATDHWRTNAPAAAAESSADSESSRTPCEYYEEFPVTSYSQKTQHSLAFVPSSYTPTVDSSVFELPRHCLDKCPPGPGNV